MKNKVAVTELEYFRLNSISPDWAKLLEKRKFPFPLSFAWFKWYFALDSPKYCIVGEAYRHNPNYQHKCKRCEEIGWEFGHAFLVRSVDEMDKTVEIFECHWNKCHRFDIIGTTN